MILGVIDLADNEVSSYLVKFVGSIFTPDFTHTLSDLSFFRYTIGSAGFPPSFPMFSSGNGLAYDADDRVIFGPVGCNSPTCVYVEATQQFAFVTRVPRAIFPRLDYLWPACLEGIAEEKKGSRDAGVSPGDWTTASIDFKLRNGRPAELPIERPVRLALAVNLKTAKALGTTIPPLLLLRADEVIQ